MPLKRLAWLGACGGALAIWFAAAATTTPSIRVAPAVAMKSAAVDASGAALAEEIERLHERLRPTAAPLHSRDLFHYRARSGGRAAVSTAAAAVPSAIAPAATPAFTFIGLAEDVVGGALQRTAIISGDGALFVVREGDAVTSRYRVSRISDDVVELVDERDQATLRLALP